MSDRNQTKAPLRVLFLSAEVFPFAKTGGLADVAGSLPKAIRKLGHDIRIVMPRYGFIDKDRWNLQPVTRVHVPMGDTVEEGEVYLTYLGDVPVYMVDNARYFHRDGIYAYPDDAERFIFFSRAALELARALDWAPHIVHCNDWHTALVPNWLKTIFKDDPFWQNTRTVFTIHNLAYQGVFGHRILEVAGLAQYGFIVHPELSHWDHVIHFMARGIIFADIITTVSPRYAQEIMTPEFGAGLDPLLRERADTVIGILNGIDTEVWNPATDEYLPQRYDVEHLEKRVKNKLHLQEESGLDVGEDIPLFGFIGRLTEQKGIDLLVAAAEDVVRHLGAQLVILGTGEEKWQELIKSAAAKFPRHVHAYLTFNNPMAHHIYGGVDMLLMPSRFEPCGLNQMIAMRYGAIPVVREVGGLADTVHDFDPRTGEGNGFSFRPYDRTALYTAMVRGVENWKHRDTWRQLQVRGMTTDFSWNRSARQYVEVYYRALSMPGHVPQRLLEKLHFRGAP
ncbi:MAG: glycogen synthase GlgA [Chloroflexi bacterium]|nr:glycogen synthase GlgA [Chloroflexota bacterium]